MGLGRKAKPADVLHFVFALDIPLVDGKVGGWVTGWVAGWMAGWVLAGWLGGWVGGCRRASGGEGWMGMGRTGKGLSHAFTSAFRGVALWGRGSGAA